MGRGISISELRAALAVDELHIVCGIISSLEVASDRSVLRVGCNILPENIEITARMSWEMVGPDFGLFQFPSVNDLVLIAFCEGHEDRAFIIKRLTSQEDKIPLRAVNGHLVLAARPGTHSDINSDTQINLTRVGAGNEALVLGNTFKSAYSSHLGIDEIHTHLDSMGYNTTAPNEASQYSAIKSSPVDDSAMLSDISKTEK